MMVTHERVRTNIDNSAGVSKQTRSWEPARVKEAAEALRLGSHGGDSGPASLKLPAWHHVTLRDTAWQGTIPRELIWQE